MALARVLMEGTSYDESVSLEGYDYSGKCHGDEKSWFDAACESLMRDIYDVDKAYMMADVMGEVQVLKEGADPQILLEGIAGGAFEKLKNMFKKFWAKIKEFFEKVKKMFKAMFLTGKKFTDEFGKELKEKARNKKNYEGFKYTGYNYTLDKGKTAGDTAFSTVEDEINNYISRASNYTKKDWDDGKRKVEYADIKSYKDSLDDDDIRRVAGTGTKITRTGRDNQFLKPPVENDNLDLPKSASDMEEQFFKDHKTGLLGASDNSELQEKLEEAYRNGNSDSEEIFEFEAISVDGMIKHIETFEKAINDANKQEKQFETAINKIIKKLDNMKNEGKDGNEDLAYKNASKLSSYFSSLLTIGKVPSTVFVAAYKASAEEYERVLKAFLRWKPAKEGYEDDTDDTPVSEGTSAGESLLESAFNCL